MPPRNHSELRERLQRQWQVLSRIEQQWQELERKLDELEARLPVLPDKAQLQTADDPPLEIDDQQVQERLPRKPR